MPVRWVDVVAGALLLCVFPAAAQSPAPDPAFIEFLADGDDGHGGVVDWELLAGEMAGSEARAVPASRPPTAETDDVAP